MIHTLPSGLQIDIRKWKLKDRKIAKHPNYVRQGVMIQRVLESVTEAIVDCGPYSEKDLKASKGSRGAVMSWDNVAWPDTISALVSSRAETRDYMAFRSPCIYCRAPMPIERYLSELEQSPMSEMGILHIKNNQPLICFCGLEDEEQMAYESREAALEAGISSEMLVEAHIEVLRSRHMPTVFKLRRQDPDGDVELMQLCAQIEKLVLPDSKEIDDYETLMTYMGEEGLNIEKAISDFVGKQSGGVQSFIEHVCSECTATQLVPVPFGPEFFMI